MRYSEDLDFVRRTHGPIGPTLDALREVASSIGLATRSTQVGKYPRIKLQASATGSGRPLRIKLEINTYETSPARPAIQVPFAVDTGWFRGGCQLTTFVPAELVATKLRALYQRSKGRDVFDLWLALEQLRLEPADILECFAPYRPAHYSAAAAITNLRAKLSSPSFRNDTDLLVTETPVGYDIDTAAKRIIDQLLSRVADNPN